MFSRDFAPTLHLHQGTILVGSLFTLFLLQLSKPDSHFFFTVHLHPYWHRINEQPNHTLHSSQFWRPSCHHIAKDHIRLPAVAREHQCPGSLHQCIERHVLSPCILLPVCRCHGINLQSLFCIYPF